MEAMPLYFFNDPNRIVSTDTFGRLFDAELLSPTAPIDLFFWTLNRLYTLCRARLSYNINKQPYRVARRSDERTSFVERWFWTVEILVACKITAPKNKPDSRSILLDCTHERWWRLRFCWQKVGRIPGTNTSVSQLQIKIQKRLNQSIVTQLCQQRRNNQSQNQTLVCLTLKLIVDDLQWLCRIQSPTT